MNIDSKFENYSRASRRRQAAIPKAVRKLRSKEAAKTRWADKSPEDRRAHALMMVNAKHAKKTKLDF